MNRYYRPKHLFFAFFCIFTVLACNTDSQKKDSLHTIPPKIDTVKKQSIRLMGNENVTKKSKKISPDTTKFLPIETAFQQAGLVNVQTLDSTLNVDLRYATTDNFVQKNMYGNLASCYLQPAAAQMLLKAQHQLQQQHPNYSLLLLDCARPLSVQQQLWNVVKGTPKQKYVASPAKHSIYNYGVAIDLTIFDTQNNTPLDMGTPYDYLGKLAQPRYNQLHLDQGMLNQQQVDNRNLLKTVMQQANFRPIPNEWWHFDGYNLSYPKKHFRVVK